MQNVYTPVVNLMDVSFIEEFKIRDPGVSEVGVGSGLKISV